MQLDQDLLIRIGELSGKMDAVLINQNAMREALKDHDKRISLLEQSRAWVIGAAAMVGMLAAIIVDFIKDTFLRE